MEKDYVPYTIRGASIASPFKLYPSQISVIDTVIKSISSKTNALIEAPTGTGKTAGLLLSVLHNIENINKPLQKKTKTDVEEKKKTKRKIIYSTRTHSQITNIVSELKRLSYRPHMTILGSRDLYCIHPKVSNSYNKNSDCKKIIHEKVRGCKYKNNMKKLCKSEDLLPGGDLDVWDIEDLVEMGKPLQSCPYFASRQLAQEVDIIFCPYNYILSPSIRDSMELNLSDSILIIDEAHNIEEAARDAASMNFTYSDIQNVRSELLKVLSSSDIGQSFESLHIVVTALEKFVHSALTTMKNDSFEGQISKWSGSDLIALLSQNGLSSETLIKIKKEYTKSVRDALDSKNSNSIPNNDALNFLDNLLYIAEFLYGWNGSQCTHSNASHYAFAIRKSATIDRKSNNINISIICLTAKIAFERISKETCSIIIASGTLSPLDSFSSELGISFSNKLETQHIINMKEQIMVSCLPIANNGTTLTGTFKNVDSLNYQDALGDTILDICKYVPSGVLCFVPSYSMLDKLMSRWNVTSLTAKLSAVKEIFVESQSSQDVDFNAKLNKYYESSQKEGAIFFAVCKGKISEGINFNDKYCRCVIQIGIPYPQVKDVKVELKKEYNDMEHKTDNKLIDGNSWYTQQAFRTVNQCIGRGIRHKDDYSAIILLDDRFNTKENIQKLSKWMRGSFKSMTSEELCKSLQSFFSNKKD